MPENPLSAWHADRQVYPETPYLMRNPEPIENTGFLQKQEYFLIPP